MISVSAFSSVISELEDNNTIRTAQNVDTHFSSNFVADIEGTSGSPSSTTIPHVTITGTTESGFIPFNLSSLSDYVDFFSFTVGLGSNIYLDIDNTVGGMHADNLLVLVDPLGVVASFNDDSTQGPGDLNSVHPFLSYTALLSGVYTAGVGAFSDGSTYELHISVDSHPVPEPTALALVVLGIAGIAYRRRRSKFAA